MVQPVTEFGKLFSSFNIGKVKLKNRIVFLPHWPGLSRDGLPTERTIYYYVERAKGGTGLIIAECQSGSPEGQMAPGYIKAYSEETLPYYRQMTDLIHKNGAKVFTQLTHTGHDTLEKPPQLLYAPTQMPEPSSRYNTKEMEIEDIKKVIEYFAKSAAIQKKGGFDGIELKVAHDGLFRSFVSPYFNHRQDEYGGNFENRMRFPLEVIKAMRVATGPDFPIGIRLCLEEFTPWGYSLDYGVKLAKAFEKGGVDYIDTDAGTFSSFYMEIPPMIIPLGFAIYMSAEVKKAVNIPVISFGRINDSVQAETILRENAADLIGMCRQLICDPETPIKAYEGRLDDIRNCIGCNDGCIYQVMQGKPLRCIQNPAAGREKTMGIGSINPSNSPKRIMVVGGGIAGMKFAEIAASRGHKVELYEKNSELGGQILLAEKLPHRLDIGDVSRYLKLQLKKWLVKVHLEVSVNIDLVNEVNPDVVIMATGSTPYMPKIKGNSESDIGITDVRQALSDPLKIGKRVVVYDKDGHWQGGGMAEYLLDLGSIVYAVTPHWLIGIDLEPGNTYLLYKQLYEKGANIVVNHSLDSVNGKKVIISNIFNNESLVIDNINTLIIAHGSKSDNSLYYELKKARSNVYIIGDCVAPRMIEQVIYESEQLAREI